MAVDEYEFIGAMDLDSPDFKIARGFHRTARNGIFRGPQGKMRFESAVGNVAINNPYLPNSGTNKTIGWHYDPVYYRLFVFNYNSNANHGIYVFYTQTGTWQTVLANGSGTDGDVLGFTTSYITSIDIYYQEPALGDIMFYVDCLGRPTNLNITRYINNTYPLIERSFIDVAKAPPVMPPQCTYENDTTVSINNLNNALFQFKERFVFDDNQKSVYSTGSIVPLPLNTGNPVVYNNPYNNARIAIYVQTGDATVTNIEIWGRQSTDATSTVNNNAEPDADYFLIVSLNKAQLAIPNNSIYRYLFYNNGIYLPGDIQEEIQLFDYVPQTANAQALLNGNVPIYGGITEGYANLLLNVEVDSNSMVTPPYNNLNGIVFFAQANGIASGGISNQITIYLSGAGANDSSGNPTTVDSEYINAIYNVNSQTLTGSSLNFTYISTSVSIPTILAGIAAQAVSAGFTVISTGTNTLVIQYSQNIVLCSSQVNINSNQTNTLYDTYFAYAQNSAYDFSLQYYDSKGRTNGAQPFLLNPITTGSDLTGLTVPNIEVIIKHRPPIWAVSYQLLRSANLSYSKRLQWISNQTFTNTDPNTQEEYAYIGISNMVSYDQDIEAATPVVSYQFQQGDRIRFEVSYPPGQPSSTLIANLDYQIASVVDNPVINGVTQLGTFISILYPTGQTASTGGSANFDFGGDNFQTYKCLIYGVAQDAAPNSTIYYEFGMQFGIGNAGTSTAFHMGNNSTQFADLSRPASIVTCAGDLFYRQRNVPAGMIYYPSIPGYSFPFNVVSRNFVAMYFDNLPITNSSYTLQDPPNPFFTNNLSVPQRLRLTVDSNNPFTLQCGANNVATIQLAISPGSVFTPQYLIKSFYMGQGENITTYEASFDAYVNVEASSTGNNKIFLYLINTANPETDVRIGGFIFKLEILNNIPIPIIESSFSDKYSIITNSNSRPSAYDPNAIQQYYSTLIRWGLAGQVGTTINQTNRFYAQDVDELDKSYGDIMRFRQRKRELRIFQKRRCGQMGVYGNFIKNQQGTSDLVVTDNIISINNVQYYEGEFGIGNQPTSLISSGNVDYFVDPVKGYFCRLSLDGVIPISETNKIQTFAGQNLPNYLNDYNYQYGGNASVVGAFNFAKDRPSEAIFMMQAGTNGTGQSIVGQSISFIEEGNKWASFYDFAGDGIVCCENQIYSFNNGVLYIHNNTTNYCNYYGIQFQPSITLVKNDNPNVKKTWLSINEVSNVIWNCPSIYTEMFSYGSTPQQSNLVDEDFAFLEGGYSANFLRDLNSIGGIIDGDSLKGTFIVLQLQVTNGSNFSYLADALVKYIVSHELVR